MMKEDIPYMVYVDPVKLAEAAARKGMARLVAARDPLSGVVVPVKPL